jgi:hypothetical protein
VLRVSTRQNQTVRQTHKAGKTFSERRALHLSDTTIHEDTHTLLAVEAKELLTVVLY